MTRKSPVQGEIFLTTHKQADGSNASNKAAIEYGNKCILRHEKAKAQLHGVRIRYDEYFKALYDQKKVRVTNSSRKSCEFGKEND